MFRQATPADVAWFMERVPIFPTSQFRGIVAHEGGPILGMLGFDAWTPKAVQIHVALDHPTVAFPLWREAKRWLRSTGRESVYATTPSNNLRSLRLQAALKFKTCYVQRNGWDTGVDMILNEYRL